MRIAILGGGISGLAAAYFLREHEVTLFEKESRVGGDLGTLMGEERGARFVQDEVLLREFGIECSEVKERRRYLVRKGKLTSIPFDLKLRARFTKPRVSDEEESIGAFAERWLGERGRDLLFDPMVRGIFGGDLRELSMQSCFPQGLLRKRGLYHLDSQALLEKLQGEFFLGEEVTAIEGASVRTTKREWEGDLIISALPAPVIGELLGEEMLKQIPYLRLKLSVFEVERVPEGIGFLVPSSEKREILGGFFGERRVTLFTHLDAQDEEGWLKSLLGSAKLLGSYTTPFGIPQYRLGHRELVREIKRRVPPRLRLLGNYLDGASLESCLAGARALREQLLCEQSLRSG